MQYPLLDLFLTMLWFFLLVLWVFLLVRVIIDIFRSQDMGGWAKAAWLVFVVVLPFLGVLVYLVARGGTMTQREVGQAREQEQAFQDYVRRVAKSDGAADELSKLADLHERGVLSDDDYERSKEKVLQRPAA